jgi:hypothetical protein
MHVPHATKFYRKFENLNFDIFCKKRLFQTKTALTFAYGFEKKHVIYENVSTKKVTLHKFLLLKIPKGNMKAGKFYILLEKLEK